jgi:hypothetical protein
MDFSYTDGIMSNFYLYTKLPYRLKCCSCIGSMFYYFHFHTMFYYSHILHHMFDLDLDGDILCIVMIFMVVIIVIHFKYETDLYIFFINFP